MTSMVSLCLRLFPSLILISDKFRHFHSSFFFFFSQTPDPKQEFRAGTWHSLLNVTECEAGQVQSLRPPAHRQDVFDVCETRGDQGGVAGPHERVCSVTLVARPPYPGPCLNTFSNSFSATDDKTQTPHRNTFTNSQLAF